MIIIFEGLDKTGKSTIAKALAKEMEIPYFKHSNQKQIFLTQDYKQAIYEAHLLLDLIHQLKLSLIIDRHIASEYAYGLAFNRYFDMDQISEIDFKLSELGAKIIHCEKVINEKDYNDSLIPYSKLKLISLYYDIFYSQLTKMKVIRLNTTDENLDNQLAYLMEVLR